MKPTPRVCSTERDRNSAGHKFNKTISSLKEATDYKSSSNNNTQIESSKTLKADIKPSIIEETLAFD